MHEYLGSTQENPNSWHQFLVTLLFSGKMLDRCNLGTQVHFDSQFESTDNMARSHGTRCLRQLVTLHLQPGDVLVLSMFFYYTVHRMVLPVFRVDLLISVNSF